MNTVFLINKAMAQKEKNELLSHLKTLMMHIIKWKTQIQKRSRSWFNTITFTRNKIEELQKDKPTLTDSWIESNWEKTFEKAKKEAEDEMKQKSPIENLSWKEVFADQLRLGRRELETMALVDNSFNRISLDFLKPLKKYANTRKK
jgi:Domain of unknown function DUF29